MFHSSVRCGGVVRLQKLFRLAKLSGQLASAPYCLAGGGGGGDCVGGGGTGEPLLCGGNMWEGGGGGGRVVFLPEAYCLLAVAAGTAGAAADACQLHVDCAVEESEEEKVEEG